MSRVQGQSVGLRVALALGLSLGLGLFAAGCAQPRPMTIDGGGSGGRDVTLSDLDRLFGQHRARSERLARLRAQGTVVMSWTTESGAREEMTDLGVTVYRDGSERVFAEVFETSVALFYAGADGRWVYFWNRGFGGEPSRFCGWSAQSVEPPPCAAIVPLLDRPRLLADMLFGVVPIPADAARRADVDAVAGTATLELAESREPLRVTWDLDTGLVRRISLLGIDGQVLLTAEHDGRVPLRVPGVSDFSSPFLPGRVRVADAAESFALRFTFDPQQRPVETVADDRWETLFDGPTSARSRQGRVDEFQVDPALQAEIDAAPAGFDW